MEADEWHLCAFFFPCFSQWVPSFFPGLHHLCALPLPHSRVEVFLGGSFYSTSCASVFMAASRGCPWSVTCGSQEVLGSWVQWDCNHQNEFLVDYTPLGHGTDNRLKHILSFAKRPICLSWSLGLRGRLQILHTYRGLWRLSQGTQAGGRYLSTSCLLHHYSLLYLRKVFIHLSRAFDFCNSCPGTPPDCLALMDSRFYICWSTGLYIYIYIL